MLKIFHIAKYYHPDAGGIETVVSTLASGAVKAGHSVSVLCFKKTRYHDYRAISKVTVLRAPTFILFGSQPLGLLYAYWCLKYSKDADIIHLHMPNMLGALCALLVSRRKRLLIHWHSDVINKGVLGFIAKPLEMLALVRADIVIAASEAYLDSSRALSFFRNKVAVLPYGVKGMAPLPSHTNLPDDLLGIIASGKKIILSIGRLVPYKGFDILIKAVKFLKPEFVVIIIGSGPLENDLNELIRKEDVSNQIFLAGALDDDQLHLMLDRSYLFCLPSVSRAEAFGVVLLEAMSHGLPIVASAVYGSGMGWINQHNESGLNIEPRDPVALAQACNLILGSVGLHEKFSHGSKKRFQNLFTEDIFIKKMTLIYEELS